jgi:hypothetical protein
MVNTSAALKNSMKYMSGIPAIGVLKTAAVVVHSQYPTGPHQLDLKYCQVAARVARQAVTMITVLVGKVVIMAQGHCKNQWMDLQMAQYTQCVLQDRQIVAAVVHVIKIVVMDAPALLMAPASATSVPLVAWAVQRHGTWSQTAITATLVTFSAAWATTMPVGLTKFVIVQYTDLMYVLEEHLGHIIISTTVALMRSQ